MAVELVANAVIAGRFRLNHPIGRGGMGSVWHATHLGLEVPCAVKFIEPQYASRVDAQSRFEREAKAAAMLRSRNVVQILDHGVCDGTPYIAMELLDGEDLAQRLGRTPTLPPREIHSIVSQVCRALTKAHALGIVHRDLKPDNIFLVRDDDGEVAKVLDFGIAKREENALRGNTTKTGALLGTPHYMSPEQAQGTKSVDFRSDLWSLAVIVYRCMTGVLPFESEAFGDLLLKIIIQPLPVPSRVAGVPPGFDAWWARAASRVPNARFASAREFADSLGTVVGVTQPGGAADQGTSVVTAPAGTTEPSHPGAGDAGAHGSSAGTAMGHTFNGLGSGGSVPKHGPSRGLLLGIGLVVAVFVGASIAALHSRTGVVVAAPAAAQPLAATVIPGSSAPALLPAVSASPSALQPVSDPSAAAREPALQPETAAHAHVTPRRPAAPAAGGTKPGPVPPVEPKNDLGF